jgi:L-alanine-DL-glutamate epimerase-like enolase superfamily enzyme
MNTQMKQQPEQKMISRRSLLKSVGLGLGAGLGGVSLAGVINAPIEQQVAQATNNVKRASAPSQLRITDMRIATMLGSPFRCPIIRIDTNQGISGYGEVRDGASETYALMLKARLLQKNPCNVEQLFRLIKQFGYDGRQGGGVSGVEMALWDLAGKAYGVPVYQMLGGKYRDTVRIYADTDEGAGLNGLKNRVALGYTWLKMDLGIGDVRSNPEAVTQPAGGGGRGALPVAHPFTGITLTDKGAAAMAQRLAAARQAVGMQIPISLDHFGSMSVKSIIKLAKALSPYNPAWMEDTIPWQYTDLLKEIRDAIDVPLITGEDIYLLENFKPLIEQHAVDYVHPDLATAGGILETKKIGDFAQEHGVAMAMHNAGTPVSFMANVHCAAATQNFLALECHAIDRAFWGNLVTGIPKPIINKGFVQVPDGPGLGIELNLEEMQNHLDKTPGHGMFLPTPEWNNERSQDHLYSKSNATAPKVRLG